MLRGMYQANIDMVILQHMRATNRVYTCRLSGYRVVEIYTLIQHRGGVAVLYCTSLWLTVESNHKFRPNVISFQMELGWYRVGYYIVLDKALNTDSAITAIGQLPYGTELLVAGYFNEKLAGPEKSTRDKDITAELET